jgi:hypothetical protein
MPPLPGDFLDAIEAAIGCQHCQGPLGDSPSGDFCREEHQKAWSAGRGSALSLPERFGCPSCGDCARFAEAMPDLPRCEGLAVI